jgi:hypothetical protein
MPVEYMGCKDCVLRFQTRAQEDGNVVGVHSEGDTEVKWNGNDSNNFSYSWGTEDNRTSSTLIPEKTMIDGNSIDTGVVNKKNTRTLDGGVGVEQTQEDYLDEDVETKVLFPEWGESGKLFQYGSQIAAETNLKSDIDDELISEGYGTQNDETQEVVVDEENVFVKTVRVWTQSVVDFFRGIFS